MFLCVAQRGRNIDLNGNKTKKAIQRFEIREDARKNINALTTVEKDNYIIVRLKDNS